MDTRKKPTLFKKEKIRWRKQFLAYVEEFLTNPETMVEGFNRRGSLDKLDPTDDQYREYTSFTETELKIALNTLDSRYHTYQTIEDELSKPESERKPGRRTQFIVHDPFRAGNDLLAAGFSPDDIQKMKAGKISFLLKYDSALWYAWTRMVADHKLQPEEMEKAYLNLFQNPPDTNDLPSYRIDKETFVAELLASAKPRIEVQHSLDLLYEATKPNKGDSSLVKEVKAAGHRTWKAADYALKQGWVPREDYPRFIAALNATREHVLDPNNEEKFKTYCKQTSETIGLGRNWSSYIGGIMLCGAATLIMATSIGVAIASFGIGAPFSAFGLALGSTLMVAGYTISATAFIAGTAVGLTAAAGIALASAIPSGLFATRTGKGEIALQMEELKDITKKHKRSQG